MDDPRGVREEAVRRRMERDVWGSQMHAVKAAAEEEDADAEKAYKELSDFNDDPRDRFSTWY